MCETTITKEEQLRFEEACSKVFHSQLKRDSIGTLSEKTLHAALKCYFEPDFSKQEVKIGRMVADIYNGDDIIEIQTRQFGKMRKKLDAFLPEHHVTIVHPIPVRKRIFYIDETTGAISKGRLSPQKKTVYHIFQELYQIKPYLSHPHLHFCILLLELEEYRLLPAVQKKRGKKGVSGDKVPKQLLDEIYINHPCDFALLLPQALPKEFTSKDFAVAAHIPDALAQVTLNVLYDCQVVKRIGKSGRNYLYRSL